jgi:hypothetical protein
VDGTPGSNDMPGRLVFRTSADGSGSNAERMRIDSQGRVGIGTAPSGSHFHVVSSGTGVKGRFSDGTSETLDIGIHSNSHAYLDQPNGGPILFTISSAEQARISTTGIALPNGKGIDFGATTNGGGNLGTEFLNDYEDGTWTPVLISGGSTNPTGGGAQAPSGRYTKIGNRVWVTFYVGRSWTNTPAGGILISGLPYTILDNTNGYYTGAVATYNVGFGDGVFLSPVMNQTYAALYATSSGASWGALNWTTHTSGTVIYVSGTFSYQV